MRHTSVLGEAKGATFTPALQPPCLPLQSAQGNALPLEAYCLPDGL